MNERVKELAEQAGFVMWADESWKPEGQAVDWSSEYDAELEKFAELIVRECSDLCLQNETYDGIFNPMEYRKGNHFYAIIKNHFGVE